MIERFQQPGVVQTLYERGCEKKAPWEIVLVSAQHDQAITILLPGTRFEGIDGELRPVDPLRAEPITLSSIRQATITLMDVDLIDAGGDDVSYALEIPVWRGRIEGRPALPADAVVALHVRFDYAKSSPFCTAAVPAVDGRMPSDSELEELVEVLRGDSSAGEIAALKSAIDAFARNRRSTHDLVTAMSDCCSIELQAIESSP